MTFPCVGCGACCVGIGHLSAELGEFLKPDGSCKHLSPDNQCEVYETRPTICRVMDIRPPAVSEETWVGINLIVCEFLHQKRYGEPLETPGLACWHKVEGL